MTPTPSRFIAILDVGHGNCCVLKDDNGIVIIDTGVGTSLLEFLTDTGITSVDVVLLSHADNDHISGLVGLLASKEVAIRRVRLNTDSAKQTKVWNNLIDELEKQGDSGKLNWQVQLTADSGEDYSVGRVGLEILAPANALAARGPGGKTTDGETLSTNSISCVVRLIQSGSAIVVVPGDIDEVGLADLIRRQNGSSLPTSILIFPHHGGLSGSGGRTPEFARRICDLFQPNTVVFSIGRGKHSTPRKEVVEAVRQRVKDVRIACTQLSEHCCQDVSQNDSAHLLPLYADGKQNNACCAGTMLIDLDSVDVLHPISDHHSKFVDQFAGALCRLPLV